MTLYLNNSGGLTLTSSGTTTGFALDGQVAVSYVTPSGTKAKVVQGSGDISPRLLFSYVKSKLTPAETKGLQPKVQNLRLLLADARVCGQRALQETLEKQIVLILRDQEVSACGFGRFVLKDDILRFQHRVQGRTVKFDRLENYARPIPVKVRNVLKNVQKKSLFDEYWVLHNDLSGERQAQTTKDRIKEKDPILFGAFAYDPLRCFHIAHWVDEYCDLTLAKFTDELGKDKVGKEYVLGEIGDFTQEDAVKLRGEIMERHEALASTNTANWRDKARQQEDAAVIDRLKAELETVKRQAPESRLERIVKMAFRRRR
jgi:hypothetical protein